MKIKICIFFIFACLILTQALSVSSLTAKETKKNAVKERPLTINLICYRNGVGLDKDINIMHRELTQLGHTVRFVNFQNEKQRRKVDVNIFIEVVNQQLFQYANQNYFMPNPDWCRSSVEEIASFDKILCKTQETLRIFKPLNPNSVFLSFTSDDHYDPLMTKDYTISLHLAGASVQKNTHEVTLTWQQNPHFPMLTVVQHLNPWDFPPIPNILVQNRYLNHNEVVFYQNVHGFHISTSGMEGFGHYIMEGLGTAAVVVTLDAPPMNEFVQDKRCLVKPHHHIDHYLANMYYFEPEELAKVMKNLYSLPHEELKEIGRKNREFYLENNLLFKQKLAEIFPTQITKPASIQKKSIKIRKTYPKFLR